MKKLVFILLLFSSSISIFGQKILFVGNSLTYSNNMPNILEYISIKNGVNIETTSLCFPNYAIIDHLDTDLFQKLIAKEKFDYVIIQQGPSSQDEGKKMLLNDGAKMKAICDKNNANLAYFMVWPSIKYYYTFDKVIENHKLAAKKNKTLLFNVGEVWKEYNKNKKLDNLYSYDDFHPSKAGSFLAALTIFSELNPTKNLKKLSFNDYKKWVINEDSFNEMVKLINKK